MSINSQKISYSAGKNDECYTPAYGVIPILKYIPQGVTTIWCPFDAVDSNYVKILSNAGYKVLYSHIHNNQNFYEYEPCEPWDIIISNPPFSKKRRIIERTLSFNKPFALLMTMTSLNDKYPKFCFHEVNRSFELLHFDKRIHFINNGEIKKKTTFSSGYFCSDFLPEQNMFDKINQNQSICLQSLMD